MLPRAHLWGKWNLYWSLVFLVPNRLSSGNEILVQAAATEAKCIPLTTGCGCMMNDGTGTIDLSPMTHFGTAPM